MKAAAVESLRRAERQCIQKHLMRTSLSGTTAVICIVRQGKLVLLNVGDSRYKWKRSLMRSAVLAVKEGDAYEAVELTRDHTPSLPEEKRRILASGGRVFALRYEDGVEGPERVWIRGRNLPGLAMSRSLCDVVAHSVGVSSMPEITEHTLTEDDRVLIIASDGLWQFISSEEVVSFIEDCTTSRQAVNRLCKVSWQRWFDLEQVVDDTTIIVVFLGKGSENYECFFTNRAFLFAVVFQPFHLANHILHDGVADGVALRLAHLRPRKKVVRHVFGVRPGLHQLAELVVTHLLHARRLLDEQQCTRQRARGIVQSARKNAVVDEQRLRRRNQRADTVAQLNATKESIHEIVADDRVVQRVQRSRREGVTMDFVQVLMRNVVEVFAARKQKGRHVVLRTKATAGNNDRIDRVLGRRLARRQIRQIAVVRVIQLVGCICNLLPMTRSKRTHVDHLTDTAIPVDHQTVGMGAHLMSVHAILQRRIATRHVNRQVVAVLVPFLRLDIGHRELQMSSRTQKNGECL